MNTSSRALVSNPSFLSIRRAVFPATALLLLLFGGCIEMSDSRRPRNQGIEYYNTGNYTDAAGSFKNSIRNDPRDYQAHYGLALSYEAMKNYHQAISEYKTTLDVMSETLAGREDPETRAKVIDSLAACVARSDQRDIETAALVKQANQSRKAEDYLIVAKVHGNSGDADSALEAYHAARLLEPKSFYINKAYGLYLVKINQPQNAVQPLQFAYSKNDKDQEVINGLRQIGIVPGLSLKDPKDLSQPTLPKGPLPEPALPTFNNNPKPANNAAPAPGAGAPVQSPRD